MVFVVNAACYGQLGDIAAARDQIDRLLALRPAYAKEMRADQKRRRYDRSVADKIAEGLRKAGFDVSEDADEFDATCNRTLGS
jgi:hypothetical protein